MEIHGFIKTTLLDYPGHVAATVFTGGCNFRCPFCHNSDLVLQPHSGPFISEDDIFTHLKKRGKILDGVCISGGEPTLEADLEDFIKKIRALGYKVKLDTNGYFPDTLARLCEQGLLDYVAMDIKHTPEKYNTVCGMKHFDISRILSSVSYLKERCVSYEFRTTLVREFHDKEDMQRLGEWLCGANAYYLQPYKESENVLMYQIPFSQNQAAHLPEKLHAHDRETLISFVNLLKPMISNTAIRGDDSCESCL